MVEPIKAGLVEGYKCVQGVFESSVTDIIYPVHGVMAFPLPAGSTNGCIHIGSPINWSAIRMAADNDANALRYLFQFLLLIVEDKTLGTPYFDPCVFDNAVAVADIEKTITNKHNTLIPRYFKNPSACHNGTSIFDVDIATPLSDYYDDGPRPSAGHTAFQSSMPHMPPVGTRQGTVTVTSAPGSPAPADEQSVRISTHTHSCPPLSPTLTPWAGNHVPGRSVQ